MQDASTFLEIIRRLSAVDIFLISFISLPFVFEAWTRVFEKLGLQPWLIGVCLGVVFAFYILLLALMISNRNRQTQREIAKDQIINYLQSKGFTMMSFDRVRQSINQTYGDSFLLKVIDSFPTELRQAKSRDGKRGIARLIPEDTIAQEA